MKRASRQEEDTAMKATNDKMNRSEAKRQALEKRANTPRARALEHFWKTRPELMKKLSKQGVIVLHHKDVTLKHKNRAKYDRWLPEDLVPMEKRAHISMHNKRKHTKLHNNRIARGLLKAKEARAGKLVLAMSPEGDTQVFLNAAQAALWLGVSR